MTDATQFHRMDATAQAELVRSGQASPLELVDHAIGRIEAVNPRLNAVIHERFELARAQARTDDLPDGPFRGVPILFKDLMCAVEGDPYHEGMQALKDAGHRATHTDDLARAYLDAGFAYLGRTNTPELGLVPTTESLAYGPAHNPWALGHTTGGSSGGSAAAVAAGLVPVAHANDGGGSIRIPAAACGLVGLKPSRGRISLGPDEGEPWNGFVARGVLTRTVRDAAALLDVIAGAVPGDPTAAPGRHGTYAQAATDDPGSLRIGLLTHAPGGMAETMPACVQAAEDAARALEELGHRVEVAAPGALDEGLIEHFITVLATNVATDLEELATIAGRPVTADDVEAITWTYREMGQATTGVRVQQADRKSVV